MTSNLLGSDSIDNKENKEDMEKRVQEKLQRAFKPEFLNRIDQIILYEPLTKAQIEKIADYELKKVQERLADKKLTLKVSEEAKKWLAENGYEEIYGARPLKRLIQNEIIDPLALLIIEGKIKDGEIVKVEIKNGKIKVGMSS